MSDRRSRRRLLVGILILLLLTAGLLVLLRSRPRGGAEVAARPEPAPGAPLPRAPAPPQAEGAPLDAGLVVPIIDDVTVEKTEVCAGEENLVTIRAHMPDGSDDIMFARIAGQGGFQVPLRAWHSKGTPETLWPRAVVYGKSPAMTWVEVPQFVVKEDCRPPRSVGINASVLPNSWADYELLARVMTARDPGGKGWPAAGPPPFVPKVYRWSFGDGTSAETAVGRVEHSFGDRAQDRLYSYRLVTVEVESTTGEKAVGRSSLELPNLGFLALRQKGIVQLFVSLNPRFPELDRAGMVHQAVRLYHHHGEPVTITRVLRYRNDNDGKRTGPEPVDARKLLGDVRIPPGPGLESEHRLDTVADPTLFSFDYEVEGQSAEGQKAVGNFSVMRPPSPPTRDRHTPVTDPLLKAKIQLARKLLGKQTVSQWDLAQLQREGRFRELEQQYPREEAGTRYTPAGPVRPPTPPMPQVGPRTPPGPPPAPPGR